MSSDEINIIEQALESGESPPYSSLASLSHPDEIVKRALQDEGGRRWLRGLDDLPLDLAEELLEHEDDFRSRRRDSSLVRLVEAVPVASLVSHGMAIASGSAAPVFWNKLSADPEQLLRVAREIVAGDDLTAAESTLYLLTLDPLDPYELGPERRADIARTGLQSSVASIRTLAAEYLFDNDPEALAEDFSRLVRDDDERVRGLTWSAMIRPEPREAFETATEIAGQEAEPVEVRRSALAAIGTHFPTSEIIELLAYFVLHPEPALALDAGNLLYRLHRHPTIATAAISSPHQEVREIGQFLLDPYRGSPAAGGSRPGDPTRSDIFAELIRQTEERAFPEDIDDGPDVG
jgi:hypothetical protein